MKLFLSYASENRDIAETVYMALIGAGHEVFYDKPELSAGENYNLSIRNSIAASDGMIFLISPQSVSPGKYTLTELKFARHKWAHPQNRVIPVLIKATPAESIPVYLRSVHILEPEGNIAAEVSDTVDRLGRSVDVAGKQSRALYQARSLLLLTAGGMFLSLLIGTLFSLVYPRVEIDLSLATLFLIVGLLLAGAVRGIWRAFWRIRR